MGKYKYKYIFQGPRIPKPSFGPQIPNPFRDSFKRMDPFYGYTWEYHDEQKKRMRQMERDAIAYEIWKRKKQEEDLLRAIGYYDKTIVCAKCGRDFVFIVRDQAFFLSKGFSEPKYCSPECREAAKLERQKRREEKRQQELAMAIQITCVECGRVFAFSKGEQDYYRSKGFTNPKRCPECRGRRKNDK